MAARPGIYRDYSTAAAETSGPDKEERRVLAHTEPPTALSALSGERAAAEL